MKQLRTLGVWLALFVVLLILIWQVQPDQPKATKTFAEFVSAVGDEKVSLVQVDGHTVIVTDLQGRRYKTTGVLDAAIVAQLSEHGVPVEYETSSLSSWITFLIPIVLVLAFLLYFVRKAMERLGGSAFVEPKLEADGTERGSRFILRFPTRTRTSARAHEAAASVDLVR